MASEEDLFEAQRDAQLALLQAIKQNADGPHSTQALRLAEAYAWLEAPRESHGGGASS